LICGLFLLVQSSKFSKIIRVRSRHSWRLKIFKKDATKTT